jgi:PAS domain S-box-containing protein
MKNKPTVEYHIPTFLNSKPIAILTIVLLYVLIARVSLLFSIPPGNVSPIYPSIGLGIASALILGRGMLFAIWLGSFATNMIFFYQASLINGDSFLKIFLLTFFIALGNLFAAAIGISLIEKYTKGEYPLKSGKNILLFLFMGVFVTCFINSIMGVSVLSMAGYISEHEIVYTFITWFLGDAIGFVILAPFILAWSHKSSIKLDLTYILKLIGIASLTILFSLVIFLYSKENKYLILTILLITTYHFDMRFTVVIIQIVTIFSVIATYLGIGPFVMLNSNDSILVLDSFLSVSTVTTLLFAGVISERKLADENLKKQAHSLNERVKELKCLHTISEIAQKKNISLEEIIKESLPVIANGYQYPEITTCHISLMGSSYAMPNFKKTIWSQECDIYVGEESLGKIEVYYLEEKPMEYEGPFLLEEGNLLKSVSDILGKAIESMQIMEELQKKQGILQSTIESPKDISIYSINRNYEYLSFNHLHQSLIIQKYNIIIEKGMSLLECIDSLEDKKNYKNEFDKVFQGKSISIIEENKNNSTYWEIKCSPIINRKDEIIGATVFSLNITDKINAADALKRSEEKYRSVFENVQDVFYITKMDGTFIEISPSVKAVTGYDATELIGSNAESIYILGNRNIFLDALKKNSKVKGFETQTSHKNGKIIDISIDATLLFDSEGTPTHIESVLRDITERKKTEEALRKSEEKYRTIFENIQDVFFQSNIDGIVIDVSPSILQHTGYTREELIGTSISNYYVNPKEREHFLKILLTYNVVTDFVIQMKTKFAEVLYISLNARLILDSDGKPSYIEGAMRNVNDRIKSEEALKKSEEKYRSIFENVQDVFFQTSMTDDLVTEISPSCETISGYTREEIIGVNALTFFYKPEQRIPYLKKLHQKGEVLDYELELKTKKGELRIVSVSSKLIYNAKGDLSHIDGVMRDITQRKINETEIANQNTRLQVQNKELEQFVYVTSHDLQEPLITLKCFSELISNEYQDTLDDQGKQYLNFIFQSSTRMQELVRGLLEYSRIGRESNLSTIDCNQIISDILADLKVLIDKNNVQFSIDNLPHINGYPLGMRLLFQNLISNAIKFRKKDTIPQISITASEQKNDWLFSVKDNGIGIEEKNYDKVFIIFKRIHNREDYEGTGIGLAQCKKIIALHGGSIWIESTLGEGSNFKFTIPKISIT